MTPLVCMRLTIDGVSTTYGPFWNRSEADEFAARKILDSPKQEGTWDITTLTPPVPTRTQSFRVREIAKEGLPRVEKPELVGRVGFILEGHIYPGWPVPPVPPLQDTLWQSPPASFLYRGVTHWVEFASRDWMTP